MDDSWQCLKFLNVYISPIIMAFGIVGNVLSIVVLRSRRMRSPVSLYLLSLAVCDSLLLFAAAGLFFHDVVPQTTRLENNHSNEMPMFVSINLANRTTPVYHHPVVERDQSSLFKLVYQLIRWHFFYPMGLTAQMATIYITVCLTAERFVAGCYPLHAGMLSSIPRARIAILSCVVCAVIYNSPRWFEMSYFMARTNGSVAEEMEEDICLDKWTPHCMWHSMFRFVYYTWGYLLFMFLLPVIALTYMNIRLIQALRKANLFRHEYNAKCCCPNVYGVSRNESSGTSWTTSNSNRGCSCYRWDRTSPVHANGIPTTPHVHSLVEGHWIGRLNFRSIPNAPHLYTSQGRVIRTEKNVTRMVLVVVGVFIACQLPAMVYNIYFGIASPEEMSAGWCALSEIRNFLVVVNSSINFVVYCCMGAKFRRSFVHVITPCLEKKYEARTLHWPPRRQNTEPGEWDPRFQTHLHCLHVSGLRASA